MIRKVSSVLNKLILLLGKPSLFFGQLVYYSFERPISLRRFFGEVTEIGAASLPVVMVALLFTGVDLGFQSYYQFKLIQAEIFVGAVTGLAIVRELSPVLVAVIIAGRSGSATTAQIGTMKVTEQLDALESMAINSKKYLGVPKLWAFVVAGPILTLVGDFVGIIGGYVSGVWLLHISKAAFIIKTKEYLHTYDFTSGLIKGLVFSTIIGIVSIYNGFNVEHGSKGVGKNTTRTVIVSYVLILVTNYFLSVLLR